MPFTAPTPANLKARYPALANIADATAQLWLDEGVTEAGQFPDDVRARAAMAYAAHRIIEATRDTDAMAGVTMFKSGDFQVSMSETRSGFGGTIYGREWLDLMRRHFGGPMMAWSPGSGVSDVFPIGYPAAAYPYE